MREKRLRIRELKLRRERVDALRRAGAIAWSGWRLRPAKPAGKVRGNLSATTHLDILPTGVLTGTLKAGSFSAAEGSSVKGEIWLERAEPARAGEAGIDDGERLR